MRGQPGVSLGVYFECLKFEGGIQLRQSITSRGAYTEFTPEERGLLNVRR
jgi:hypothetical protein